MGLVFIRYFNRCFTNNAFDLTSHYGVVIIMKLELIGENWNTIRYKSRIHLPQDTEFTTLDPDPNNQVIRNGQKYCSGKKCGEPFPDHFNGRINDHEFYPLAKSTIKKLKAIKAFEIREKEIKKNCC